MYANENLFLTNKILTLKRLLGQNKLDLRLIQEQIDEMYRLKMFHNFDYMSNLLNPSIRGVKIPSLTPQPSYSFTLTKQQKITTNASGKSLVVFRPFFLTHDYRGIYRRNPWQQRFNYLASPLSTFLVYTEQSSNNLVCSANPIDVGQTVPEGLFQSYRLVSASLKVRFNAEMKSGSGFISGAQVDVYDPSIHGKYYTKTNPGLPFDPEATTYQLTALGGYWTQLSSLQARPSFQIVNTLGSLSFIYYPLDTSMLEYYSFFTTREIVVSKMRNGSSYNPQWWVDNPLLYKQTTFAWVIRSEGLPANTTCLLFDIQCNFECLPTVKAQKYIQPTLYPYSLATTELNRIISAVRERQEGHVLSY